MLIKSLKKLFVFLSLIIYFFSSLVFANIKFMNWSIFLNEHKNNIFLENNSNLLTKEISEKKNKNSITTCIENKNNYFDFQYDFIKKINLCINSILEYSSYKEDIFIINLKSYYFVNSYLLYSSLELFDVNEITISNLDKEKLYDFYLSELFWVTVIIV